MNAGFVIVVKDGVTWIAVDADGYRLLVKYEYASAFCTVTIDYFKKG